LAAAARGAEPSDPLIDVRRGTLPIIISAPHGGLEDVPGVPVRTNRDAFRFVTGADVNTRELAHAIIREIEKRVDAKPYYVVARFRRRYLDVNRTPEHAYESPGAKFYYDAYHDTLAQFCREVQNRYGVGLLIDVHGQATYKDQVLVGTVGGESVKLLRQRKGDGALVGEDGVVGFLQRAGFRTQPALDATDFNVPRYNGGHITQAYGSNHPAGVDAVQFEFGSNYRKKEQLADTASRAADAVESYYRAYLVRTRQPTRVAP
jgi:N-formylglutamate amidohydrolase